MSFFKTLIKNRKLAFQLGKNDFRNRFANTSLGAMWGFLQPFVFMLTYVIVFQYILKTGSSGEYPYVICISNRYNSTNIINIIKFYRTIFVFNCNCSLFNIWIFS